MAAIILCVLLILCCCMLASFYAFLLYAAYVISYQVRNLRSDKWVSIVSLFEPGDSCIECSRVLPHRVRWRGLTVKLLLPSTRSPWSGILFMGMIIPWVLAGFCLCILILSYVLLSYAVYLIMWKGKELGAWIISFNCSSSQLRSSAGCSRVESGTVQSQGCLKRMWSVTVIIAGRNITEKEDLGEILRTRA